LVELPGKAAEQGCRAKLPGKAAGQGCRARLPGKTAGQGCRARLPRNPNPVDIGRNSKYFCMHRA
jgi:hypothetical protein